MTFLDKRPGIATYAAAHVQDRLYIRGHRVDQ